MTTTKQYVRRNNITVTVEHDRGSQVENGWEHHAYVLAMHWNDGALSRSVGGIKWHQGVGIETVPQDEPAWVLDALVGDATTYLDAESFEDFCNTFGYDTDSRAAERDYHECGENAKRLRALCGSEAEFQNLLRVERM